MAAKVTTSWVPTSGERESCHLQICRADHSESQSLELASRGGPLSRWVSGSCVAVPRPLSERSVTCSF